MTRRFLISGHLILPATVFLALLLSVNHAFSQTAGTGNLSAYQTIIAEQGTRVVSAAKAGKESELKREVRLLRARMHENGILSINVLPDLVFEKASREGWKKKAVPSLRILLDVSPLSVPLWAWLTKEDLSAGRLPELLKDLEGLAGATRRFGPASLGYAAWLITYLFAAGCWFVLWGSSILFLRARPSLEGDLSRILDFKSGEYAIPVIVTAIFLVPLAIGCGLAVAACVWLLLCVAYMRRSELIIMVSVLLILAGLLLGAGILHSLGSFANDAENGWVGGDGHLSDARNERADAGQVMSPGGALPWMRRFEKARVEMQSGDSRAAENSWTLLLKDGKDLQDVLNNRGVARAQQGKIHEALADFESAAVNHPGDPSALWNAYQAHVLLFNLDRARRIQPEVWERVQKMAPYFHRPAEMEQGEWIASPIPVHEIRKAAFRLREDWLLNAGESDLFVMFFRPLTASGAILFITAVLLSSSAWSLLSRKVWAHATCRSCGSRSLVVRGREVSDLCAPCRVSLGGGIRMGRERSRRVQGIVLHRRFVYLASLAVPGAGALWSGKALRVLAYGILLSMVLAAVTCSLGGFRGGGPLVADLQKAFVILGFAALAVVWIAGAAWGISSFTTLQRDHNVAGERA